VRGAHHGLLLLGGNCVGDLRRDRVRGSASSWRGHPVRLGVKKERSHSSRGVIDRRESIWAGLFPGKE